MSCQRAASLGLPLVLVAGLGFAAPQVSGQLADLQPGRNFPVATEPFGSSGFSEHIDVGDVDNDGDLDVIVGNGGFNLPAPNRIFINAGGLQGGTEGAFTEETATRFAGIPDERTRDIEFVDIDLDGDLDIHTANEGNPQTGAVSRWYVNQGGAQNGTLGYFVDESETRWGTLVNVPPNQEVGTPDGQGPFNDWSCGCDFADLDGDGDQDLFHGSYGPGHAGNKHSRIFLNDGEGVFHELWPWADPAADTQMRLTDVELADFDGDFDIDVLTSDTDQARVFINNLYGGGATPFTDITQTALLDPNGQQPGYSYEVEITDMDGDGDFDAWSVGYASGQSDRLLRNNGPISLGGPFRFGVSPTWLDGPAVGDGELDFIDYDSDGDLDAHQANFSGSAVMFTHHPVTVNHQQVLFHRNDSGAAPWPELPSSNAGSLHGGQVGDMDGDGDPDLLWSRAFGSLNRYVENVLGVPDTFAPTFAALSDPCDKPEGTATVIHAAVRDNSPGYLVDRYATVLAYSVDGGAETAVPMQSQGGQQFRGVIPPQAGEVSWRVEVTDRAGNTGVSGTDTYTQAGFIWTNQGFAFPGSGPPTLTGTGTWEAETAGSLDVTGAPPSAYGALFYGVADNPTPLGAGFLLPFPFLGPVFLFADGTGEVDIDFTFPSDLPCGLELYMQFAFEDPGVIGEIALTNALKARTP